MIQVKKYAEQSYEHFDSNGKSIGFLNEFENLDLRCQIAEQSAKGYYLVFNDKKIEINENGKLVNCPSDLYGLQFTLYERLFNATKNKKPTTTS